VKHGVGDQLSHEQAGVVCQFSKPPTT
jgi:hypothetical protein